MKLMKLLSYSLALVVGKERQRRLMENCTKLSWILNAPNVIKCY